MKRLLSLIALMAFMLVGCGEKEITIEETKDIYQKIYVLSDTLGEATALTENTEYIEIKDKAKAILDEVENTKMDSKAKELMVASCNSVIENCRLHIDKGWKEASNDFENISNSIDELEKYITELK